EGDFVEATLPVAIVAGETAADLGTELTAVSGARYHLEKLRFYVGEVALLRDDGTHEHALLLDTAGEPLAYGVHLVDAADPDSLGLSFRAPRGTYTRVELTVGVPSTCPDGETQLNHVDASEMAAPLDVDADMYWSWDPGYTFFKVEGRVSIDGADEPFFYHVGEEERLMHVAVEGPLVVDEGTTAETLVVDVNRLFVTADGQDVPRLDGDDDDRKVHSGALSDQVKANIEQSGVLTLR
ncbi:MAG: MbnP family protein, partial [Myxococcota bacterium]